MFMGAIRSTQGLMSEVGRQTSDFERAADTSAGDSTPEWPASPFWCLTLRPTPAPCGNIYG